MGEPPVPRPAVQPGFVASRVAKDAVDALAHSQHVVSHSGPRGSVAGCRISTSVRTSGRPANARTSVSVIRFGRTRKLSALGIGQFGNDLPAEYSRGM